MKQLSVLWTRFVQTAAKNLFFFSMFHFFSTQEKFWGYCGITFVRASILTFLYYKCFHFSRILYNIIFLKLAESPLPSTFFCSLSAYLRYLAFETRIIFRCFSLNSGRFRQNFVNAYYQLEDIPLTLHRLGTLEKLNAWSKFEVTRTYSCWVRTICFTEEVKQISKMKIVKKPGARKWQNQFNKISRKIGTLLHFSKMYAAVKWK